MAQVELIQDESGQIFARMPAGDLQPVTEQQATLIHSNPGAIMNILGSAVEGMGALAAGAGQLVGVPGAKEVRGALAENLQARSMTSPISTMAGTAAPLVAAGAITGGASIPAQMAGWGAVGASMDPDHPLTGALLSAGLVAAPGAAMSLIRSEGAGAIVEAARTARNRIPGIRQTPAAQVDALIAADNGAAAAAPATPAAAVSGPAAAVSAENRAPRSILGSVADTGAPEMAAAAPAGPLGTIGGSAPAAPAAGGRRILEGFLHPDELKAAGMEMTPGDARALLATTPEEMTAAQAVRNTEEKARSGLTGGPIESVRTGQKAGFTNWVKRELGFAPEDAAALTDTRMGRFFRGINQEFEQTMQTIKTATPQAMDRFKTLAADVSSNASSESQRVVDHFVTALQHETAGGALTRDSIQTLDRTLNNAIKAANRQGLADKVSDLTTLRTGLMSVVEDSAPAGIAKQIQDLQRRYALGATLLRPGARDTAGVLNPQTVRNAWNLNKAYAKTAVGNTGISRMLETAAYLDARITPTSGTAERILSAAGSKAKGALLGMVPGL